MGLIRDIWRSFNQLPRWVRVWVALWLVPVNLAGAVFLDTPVGVAALVAGVAAMGPNLFIMIAQRGLGKAMALPHLIPWTALVIWLGFHLTGAGAPTGAALVYGWIVLATNILSLGFDYPDAVKWARGDRAPAGSG